MAERKFNEGDKVRIIKVTDSGVTLFYSGEIGKILYYTITYGRTLYAVQFQDDIQWLYTEDQLELYNDEPKNVNSIDIHKLKCGDLLRVKQKCTLQDTNGWAREFEIGNVVEFYNLSLTEGKINIRVHKLDPTDKYEYNMFTNILPDNIFELYEEVQEEIKTEVNEEIETEVNEEIINTDFLI